MRRRGLPRLNPHADLVVIYPGTDSRYHRLHPDQPNKPACAPDGRSGVLTRTKSAKESGLRPCRRCREELQ
jgi:hypothetical protein